jgi:hypothetical protein
MSIHLLLQENPDSQKLISVKKINHRTIKSGGSFSIIGQYGLLD